MLISKKDLQIVCSFRNNARENLTTASRKLRIPVSTIYDRLKKYQGTLIKRHTTLLDFKKLGYSLKVMFAIKTDKDHRDTLLKHLESHHRVNSVYRVSNNSDFMVEVLFKDLRELNQFKEKIEDVGAKDIQEFYVVDDIKRESFLSNQNVVDLIADID